MSAASPKPDPRVARWRDAAVAAMAVIVAVAAQAACAAGGAEPAEPAGEGSAQLGTELSLRLGESVDVDEERLTLAFAAVTRDNRCPTGVQCIVAGEAVVVFEARCGDREAELTFEFGHRNPTHAFEGYGIEVTAVDPHPKAEAQIEPEDYVVRFVVERP